MENNVIINKIDILDIESEIVSKIARSALLIDLEKKGWDEGLYESALLLEFVPSFNSSLLIKASANVYLWDSADKRQIDFEYFVVNYNGDDVEFTINGESKDSLIIKIQNSL